MTSNTNYFIDLFWYFAPQLPVIAIWLLGVILACLSWRKHPQVSLMALAAFAIQLPDFRIAAERFGVILRIGDSHDQLQRVRIQAPIAFFQAHLVGVRIAVMIQPSPLVRGYDGQYLPEGFSSQNIAEKT